MGTAHGVEGGRPSQEDTKVDCVGCRQKLPLQAFDAERLSIWKRTMDITKQAKCKACWAKSSEEEAEVECGGCLKKVPSHAFDAERLSIWKGNMDITKILKCKACWAKLPDGMRNA